MSKRLPRKTSKRVIEKDLTATPQSVAVQTEELNDLVDSDVINKYKMKISNLENQLLQHQEQIKKLMLENEALKNESRFSILSNKAVTKIKNSPASSTKGKGCACKGNCANRICGCVKKGLNCKEFCRCNDATCQNQDKENIDIEEQFLSEEGQLALEKLSHLTIDQEGIHLSKKKSSRGQFLSSNATPSLNRSRRKLFQETDDFVDINDQQNEAQLSANILTPKPTIVIKSPIKSTKSNKLAPALSPEKYSDISAVNKEQLENITKRPAAKKNHSSPAIYQNGIKNDNNNASPLQASTSSGQKLDLDDPNFNPMVPKKQLPRSPIIVTQGNSDENDEQTNLELHPMVPKKQLPRSPVLFSTGARTSTPNLSKKFSPPKKELAVEKVDWEEHKQNLVQCSKCKRSFFPYRIEKHIASCKKI